MKKISKQVQFGEYTLTMETGEIARQANGAVLVSMEGTVVLVTVVGKKESNVSRDFFPLTVNYQERRYAAGQIPGGFIKREGRPNDNETLVSRLIDRPLRPLFPEGFNNDVQIIATVMSLNPEINPDILALVGASAAVAISGIPFNGPIAGARVGYKDGIYMLNPKTSEMPGSQLDLVVAGTAHAILMVESQAQELSENIMLGAVLYGHEMMQGVIRAINELAKEVGNSTWTWTAPHVDQTLQQMVTQQAENDVRTAYQVRDKLQRQDKLAEVRRQLLEKIAVHNAEQAENAFSEAQVLALFSNLESDIVRNNILDGQPRIDGRDKKTVRPITIRSDVLPRAHGSALFTRGETQAIVVATLGSERDAQILDSISGESKDRFMLHYNFPPYCVGEVGMVGSPKRREIGHGRLARRAIEAVLPNETDFPYVLRVVSEITESNGSSSMATVCGTTLALMDAGVPIKAPVAGIAMGLIKEGDRFAVLTDILGDEDHLGDMDFKVAGTGKGVTALQMDIKIDGITKEIMHEALEQALQGRLHILGIMNQSMSEPRENISEFAPRIVTMHINPDKIRDVIGKGGATIRSITETTGVTIDINDDGVVKLFSPDNEAAAKAVAMIETIVAEVEVGKIYQGKIARIVDFGAFVTILPGRDGLLHISQISDARVENVTDFLAEGQVINVKVLDVDRQGRVKLSMKEIDQTEMA